MCAPGLVEEKEVAQMEDLLERRTKRLYFWGPRAELAPPRALARHYPVLSHLSDADFDAALRVRPALERPALERPALSTAA